MPSEGLSDERLQWIESNAHLLWCGLRDEKGGGAEEALSDLLNECARLKALAPPSSRLDALRDDPAIKEALGYVQYAQARLADLHALGIARELGLHLQTLKAALSSPSSEDVGRPDAVSDLLAVLCRDGGHYEDEHGRQAAARFGLDRVNEFRQTLAENNLPPFDDGGAGEDVGRWRPMEEAPKDRSVDLYRPTAVSWMQVAPGAWEAQASYVRPRPYWACEHYLAEVADCRKHPPTAWRERPTPPLSDEQGVTG